ncbi:MAG: serine hydrolase [Bacteroidetes bacterium B1(2017)]|nr:MAG: serine hydrolase [Bacteroidetes bacterium B1(2017)]
MKKGYYLIFLFLSTFHLSAQSLYFPPLIGKTWDTLSPSNLGWCVSKTDSLYSYLESKNTKGFLVLQDGKIVLEKYFGTFTQDSFWYWASAGKTMSALMIGIAQQKGLLSINDTSSTYLGKGWTSLSQAQEDKIKIRHQLTMTSGLDDTGVNKDCTFDSCLVYKADAGTRWAYHNAPYTLLDKVLEAASSVTWQQFFNVEVRNKTGIGGLWIKSDFNNVLYSNTRSMARYGLLLLNQGKWDQTTILNDTAYFRQMTHASQTLNPAYGYLTWLNGSPKFMAPGSQLVFNGMLAPNAPSDMFAAMGKNGQLINVVPSLNLVLVRIGDAPGDNGEVPISFNNDIWFYLNKVMCKGVSGLNQLKDLKGVSIYPNPAQTSIEIQGLNQGQNCTLKIMDLRGNILSVVTNEMNLNISDLSAGCYILSLETQTGVVYKKFVKN